MKKKFFITFIALCLSLASSPVIYADGCQTMEDAVEEMNEMHRPGLCCEDAAFTAIGSSMFGWGIGLAVGIALLTGLLHQSKAGHN